MIQLQTFHFNNTLSSLRATAENYRNKKFRKVFQHKPLHFVGGLVGDQICPKSVRLRDHLFRVALVHELFVERKRVERFAVGNLVNAKPLAGVVQVAGLVFFHVTDVCSRREKKSFETTLFARLFGELQISMKSCVKN